jgi:cell division protein FtsB
LLAAGPRPPDIPAMARRIKQSRSLLGPLAENFVKRLSNTDARLRRMIVMYGFVFLGVFFLYSLMSGTYGIPRIVRLELEKKTLIDANRRQLAQFIDAAAVRKMLTSDRNYIEYIARTRYHMVYPNEVIYRYRGR